MTFRIEKCASNEKIRLGMSHQAHMSISSCSRARVICLLPSVAASAEDEAWSFFYKLLETE